MAVIGAGISGLSVARTLHNSMPTEVYDRARRIGGRVSSRRIDGSSFLDFGAPRFDVSRREFARQVEAWESEGIAHRWQGIAATVDSNAAAGANRTPRHCDLGYVGVPSMNALAEHLARDLVVRTDSEVSRVQRRGRDWRLYGNENELLGVAQVLILAMPSEQAMRLLTAFPSVGLRLEPIKSSSRWVVLLSYHRPLSLSADRLEFEGHEALETAWHESAKPGRTGQHWVLHARTDWSADRLDAAPATVAADLSRAFSEALKGLPKPVAARAHRWRYSQPRAPLQAECVWEAALSLAVCGDWCCGGGVQGALLSGIAAAKQILECDRLFRTGAAG